MPTIAQVEEQILACEGFRVRLTPLAAKTKSFPSYDFIAMAPQRWRASDWKNIRLAAYVTCCCAERPSVLTARGHRSTGAQLGNVRDSYYAAKYGSLVAEAPHPIAEPTFWTQRSARTRSLKSR